MLKAGRPSSNVDRALQQLQKEDDTHLNIRLPKSLHKKVKLLATEQETTITEIITNLLEEYIKKYSK